MNVCIL